MKYFVGVDLGGTNIAVGLCDENGKLLHQDSVPTGAHRPASNVLADMADLILKVVADSGHTMSDISGVGVGSPGAADTKSGVLIFSNNLNWRFVQVREELQKKLGKIPVALDNDANVAALAELYAGCAQDVKNVVLLTLGTGVGGGIIIDGKILGGCHHVGAEIGHMCMDPRGPMCTCGNRGCFERYTSATALIQAGRRAVVDYPGCAIHTAAGGDMEKVTAKVVLDAAKAGDVIAREIFDNYVYYLAMGCISIINLFDPEVIALGGGVSKAGDFLLDAVQKVTKEHIFYKDLPHARIEISPLGNEAGIIGAAMLGKIGEIG
ncbi:MAG: ROK family protein [Christensenellales bacterium]|jgi:glucokinase